MEAEIKYVNLKGVNIMQLSFSYQKKYPKKKFTIIPAVNIHTTPEERERFKNSDEDQKVMMLVKEKLFTSKDLVKPYEVFKKNLLKRSFI